MVFGYSHRSVLSSAIFTELSSGSSWEQIWKPQSDIMQKERPWDIQLQMRGLQQILPLRAQGTLQERRQKTKEIEGMENTGRTRLSKSTEQTHMNLETGAARMGPTQLCIMFSTDIAFCLALLWDSWICEHVGVWVLYFLLGLLTFLLACLMQLQYDGFVLS